jgi:hypothetical protein
MTPRRRKVQLWKFSAGARGYTVKVCEREPNGVLYAQVFDPAKGYQVYISLKHRDRDRAQQYARDEAEKLRHGRSHILTGVVTVGQVLDLYLAHRTPKKKSKRAPKEDERRAKMWRRVLGADTPVSRVTIDRWEAFAAKRATGALDAQGATIKSNARRPVGEQTVAHEGRFLRAAFYWAMRWRTEHGPLLTFNPLGAPAPGVKSAFELPKNPTPKRPIVSDDRFEKVRAASEHVLMQARSKTSPTAVQVATKPRRNNKSQTLSPVKRWMERSYLPELLDLHWETGHRRGAILDLRYNDLVWERGAIIAIRWRPVKHDEHAEVIPVSVRARQALERIIAMRPGIGALPLFPSLRDPKKPMSEKTADEWLYTAEEIAKVGHLDGGRWHPLRRGWATKRKHLPDVDVAAAGGWKRIEVMKQSYQQADDETLRTVVNEPARLEERKA